MKTYYEILDIATDSSREQIKKAFRKRAKELHPDVNPFRTNGPGDMQGLIRAYETLMDPVRREDYDRRNFIFTPEVRFNYRDFLKSRPDDPAFQARLVFFDLLHHNESEAIERFDKLRETDAFDLIDHLDREDYMDCAFLLAEEYENHLKFQKSFHLLLDLVEMEAEEPYFRHFFLEVTDRLRTLVCFRMVEHLPAETVLEYLNQLVVMDLPPKDLAFYLKKGAELYLDMGDTVTAGTYLQRGLELDQKLAGTKKLRDRLKTVQAV